MSRFAAAPLLASLSLALTLGACGGGDGGEGDETGGALEFDVPTNATDLQAFLDAGEYAGFEAESAVHASTNGSPHGPVRVFVNPTLGSALANGESPYPAGSAAIKEIYAEDMSTRTGWAVMVKLQADSEGGEGWYWYELLDGSVLADGTGELQCTGCHIASGSDLFASTYPFQ